MMGAPVVTDALLYGLCGTLKAVQVILPMNICDNKNSTPFVHRYYTESSHSEHRTVGVTQYATTIVEGRDIYQNE